MTSQETADVAAIRVKANAGDAHAAFTPGVRDTAPAGRNIGEIWSVAIVAVLIALFLQVVYLARYDFNPAVFVGMPEWLAVAAGDVPRNIPRFLTGGHDGGYIYLFAREPFHPRIDLVSIHIERPLLPLMAWFLALGQPAYVVYTPQILNLLATALIAAVCAIALRSRGIDYRWAVVCALGPGLAMPLRFNLVDQVVLAWLVTGFLMFDRRRHGVAALCLSLAILARPMSLGAAGVAALVAAFKTEDRRYAFWYVLCPVPYFVWRMYLLIEAGYPVNLFTGAELFTGPSVGFLEQVENLTRQLSVPRLALFIVGIAFYVLIAVATVRRAWRVRLLGYESLLILGYTAAVLALPQTMGAGPIQMARLTPIFPFVLYLFAGDSAAESRLVTGAILGMALFGSLWWLTAPTMT